MRWRYWVALVPLVVVGCTADEADPSAEAAPPDRTWIYVQTASSGRFVPDGDGWRLVLDGVAPVTTAFTDRPDREVGRRRTAGVVADFDRLLGDAAPAAITVQTDRGVEVLAAHLSAPRWGQDRLTYDATLSLDVVPGRHRPERVPRRFQHASVVLEAGDAHQVVRPATADVPREHTYAQTAARATWKSRPDGRHELRLHGISGHAVRFSEAPAAAADTVTTAFLAQSWPTLFGDDPPNAVLSGGDDDEVVVTLEEPVLDGGDLRFLATVRSGAVETMHEVGLFVDAARTTSQTLRWTGAWQTWTVPTDVTSVTVEAWGGAGSTMSSVKRQGYGGYATSTVAVTPGQVLQVVVGAVGKPDIDDCAKCAGNGGGSSGVYFKEWPQTVDDVVVIAGGGGGGGLYLGGSDGGDGGNSGHGGDASDVGGYYGGGGVGGRPPDPPGVEGEPMPQIDLHDPTFGWYGLGGVGGCDSTDLRNPSGLVVLEGAGGCRSTDGGAGGGGWGGGSAGDCESSVQCEGGGGGGSYPASGVRGSLNHSGPGWVTFTYAAVQDCTVTDAASCAIDLTKGDAVVHLAITPGDRRATVFLVDAHACAVTLDGAPMDDLAYVYESPGTHTLSSSATTYCLVFVQLDDDAPPNIVVSPDDVPPPTGVGGGDTGCPFDQPTCFGQQTGSSPGF